MFNSTTKLILATLTLFGLIIFSLNQSKTQYNYRPLEVLLDSKNGQISLNQFKGKYVIMYFGFLSCPEACPTTLSKVATIFKSLPEADLNKIEMVFVDLDPERDTLTKLNEYTRFFHPKIIPVHLDLVKLEPFARFFGIEFKKVPLKSNMGYTIDHTTDMVLLSKEGKIMMNLHHDDTAQVLLLNVLQILKEQPTAN